MPECGVDEFADFVQVFSDCSPDDVTSPVGFTVLFKGSGTTTELLVQYAVVPFDNILSNYGDHFDVKSHSFV